MLGPRSATTAKTFLHRGLRHFSYLVVSEEYPLKYTPTPVDAKQPAKIEQLNVGNTKLIVSDKFAKRVSFQFAIYGGSSSESASQKGAAHFLANAAYTGNQKNTGLKLVRYLESQGVSFSARSDREKIVYEVSALPDRIEPAISGVVAAISSAPYAPHVYEEFKGEVSATYESALALPSTHIGELIHEAAYGETSGFGKSIFASSLSALSVSDIVAYRDAHFVLDNIAISADGISSNLASSLLSAYLPKIPTGKGVSGKTVPSATYQGGEVKVRSALTAGETDLALAFPVPKGELGKAQEVLAANLAGFLKQHGVAAKTFLYKYSSGGIFGFHLSGSAESVTAQLTAAITALKSLKTLDSTAVTSWKNKAALNKVLSLEGSSRTGALLDSLLIGSSATALSDLRTVSAADLTSAATDLFKANPSYVVFGATAGTPSFATVKQLLA